MTRAKHPKAAGVKGRIMWGTEALDSGLYPEDDKFDRTMPYLCLPADEASVAALERRVALDLFRQWNGFKFKPMFDLVPYEKRAKIMLKAIGLPRSSSKARKERKAK